MMLSWSDWDRAMPRRPDQPGDDEPVTHTPACVWCRDVPEPGHTLCKRCLADLAEEQRIYRSNP